MNLKRGKTKCKPCMVCNMGTFLKSRLRLINCLPYGKNFRSSIIYSRKSFIFIWCQWIPFQGYTNSNDSYQNSNIYLKQKPSGTAQIFLVILITKISVDIVLGQYHSTVCESHLSLAQREDFKQAIS